MNISIVIFILLVIMTGLVNASHNAFDEQRGDYDYPNTDGQFKMESFESSNKENKRPFVLLIPLKNMDDIDESEKREIEESKQTGSRSRKTRCEYPNILGKTRRTTIAEDPREYNFVSRSTSTERNVENPHERKNFHKLSAENAKSPENNLRESRKTKREDEDAIRERVILQPRSQDSVILFGKKLIKSTDKGPKKYVCYCVEEDYETTKLPTKPSSSYKIKKKRVPDISVESRYGNERNHEKLSKLVELEQSKDAVHSQRNLASAILMKESGSSKRLGRAQTDSPIPPGKKIRPETILPCVSQSKTFGQPIKIDIPLTSVRKLGSNFYGVDRKWPFAKILQSAIQRNEALVGASADEISNGLRRGQDCVGNEQMSYNAYQQFGIVPNVAYPPSYLSAYLIPEYMQYPTYRQYNPYGDGLLGRQKVASVKSADQPFLGHEEPSCDENEAMARGRNFLDIEECIRLYGPDYCNVISRTFDDHRHVGNFPEYEYPTIVSYRQEEARNPIAELPRIESTRSEYPTNVYNTDKLAGHYKNPGASGADEETFQPTGEYSQGQIYKQHPITLFRYVAANQPTRPLVSDPKCHTSTATSNGFIGSTQHQKKMSDFDEYDNNVDPRTLTPHGNPHFEYLLLIEDTGQAKEDLRASGATEMSINLQAPYKILSNRYVDTTIKATKEHDPSCKDISKNNYEHMPSDDVLSLTNLVTTVYPYSINDDVMQNPNEQKIVKNLEYTTIISDYTTRPDDYLGITKQPMSMDDYLPEHEESPEVTTQWERTFFTAIEESRDNQDARILPESRIFNKFSDSREYWYPTTEYKEYEATYVLGAKEPEDRGSALTTLTRTNGKDETVSSGPPGREEYDEDTEKDENYVVGTTKQVILQSYHTPDLTESNVGQNKEISEDKDENNLSPKVKASLITLIKKVVNDLTSAISDSSEDEPESARIDEDSETKVLDSLEDIIYRPESTETHSAEKTSWDEELFTARSTEKLDTAVKKLPIIPVREHVFKDGHWNEENALVGDKREYFEPEIFSVKTSGKDEQSTENVVGMDNDVYSTMTEESPVIYRSETNKEEDEKVPIKYYSPADRMLAYRKNFQTSEVMRQSQEEEITLAPESAGTDTTPDNYGVRSKIRLSVTTWEFSPATEDSMESVGLPESYSEGTASFLSDTSRGTTEESNEPWLISTPLTPITEDTNYYAPIASEFSTTIHPLDLNDKNYDYTAEEYFSEEKPWTTEKTAEYGDIVGNTRSPMSESYFDDTFGNGEVVQFSTLADVKNNLEKEISLDHMELSTDQEFSIDEYDRYTTDGYVGSKNQASTKKPKDIMDKFNITESPSQDILSHSLDGEHDEATNVPSTERFSDQANSLTTDQLDNNSENVSEQILGIVNSENIDQDISTPGYGEKAVSQGNQLGVTSMDEESSTEKIGKLAESSNYANSAMEATTKDSTGAAGNEDYGPSNREISNERLAPHRDKTVDHEKTSPPSIERSNHATPEWDPTYFGKIIMSSVNPVGDKTSDLKNTDLFYVGDGVKIPLKISKMPDGSWGLSISDKMFLPSTTLPRDGNVVEERKRSSDASNGEYDVESIDRGDHFDYLDEAKISDINGETKGRYARSFLKSDVVATSTTPVLQFAKRYNLTLDLPDFPNGSIRSWRQMIKSTEDIENTGKRDRERSLNDAQNLKLFGNENSIGSDGSKDNEARIGNDYDSKKIMPKVERAKIVVNPLDGMTISASEQNLGPTLDYHDILERAEENSGQDQSQWNENGDYELTAMAKEIAKYGYQRDSPIFERIRFIKKIQMEQGPYRYQQNIYDEAKERMDVMTTVLHWLKKVFTENTVDNDI